MKVKKIRIRLMDLDEWFNHVGDVLKDFNKGIYKEYPKTASFANINLLRKTLSPRRLQLLSVIKHQNPKSIYELSKMVKRDRKAVTIDINILNELGFVELNKKHEQRDMIKPEVSFEEINIGVKI